MGSGWGEVETLVRDQRVLTVILTGDGHIKLNIMNTVWMIAQRAPATNVTYRKFTKSRHTKRRGRGAHSSAQIVKEMCTKG